MSRKTPVPCGPCAVCGQTKRLYQAQHTQCDSCYQRARRDRPLVPTPDPPLCACGRPAHPTYGTCYRCGEGWPQLGHAKPSESAPVFPGRMIVRHP